MNDTNVLYFVMNYDTQEKCSSFYSDKTKKQAYELANKLNAGDIWGRHTVVKTHAYGRADYLL